MKYRWFLLVMITSLTTACGIKMAPNGQVISDVSFEVEKDRTISLPMTRSGAMPSETQDYKIIGADYSAALKKGDPAESGFTMNFLFRSKTSKELEFVVIDQVFAGGKLVRVLEDKSPVLNKGTWMGKSASVSAEKSASPWLYEKGNSTFLFKFTIKAKHEEGVEIYQPSLFSKETKAIYLSIMFPDCGK